MENQSPFFALDNVRFNWFHGKSMITTGMGVFTDGYDLSSIGIVLPMVLASLGIKNLTGMQSSFLAGSALIGAAIGALLFGLLANRGRKAFYGLDVFIMAIASLAQAFVTNVPELILIRFILGVGIGADYVLSPLIMAENANKQDRGKSMAIGFGLTWGLGATFAAILYLILGAMHEPQNIIWRVVLGFGVVPAASVIYLRRKLPETPRFLARIKGDRSALQQVIQYVVGEDVKQYVDEELILQDHHQATEYWKRNGSNILTACLLWFLFDIVVYSGILFGPSLIAKGLNLTAGTFQLVMEFAFTVPGAIIAVIFIDRWGRKPLQALGFIGMAIALGAFSFFRVESAAIPMIGLILYGSQNLFSQIGPGSVSASGMLGVELAPTKIRSFVQGITVASGRLGASFTAFVFPALFQTWGESFAIGFLSTLALFAAIITILVIPETKKQSLEETSREIDRSTEVQTTTA
ncbi:MFS transporter [Sulfoacidibacillus thermotolerans]|uniref:MFS transporter n=1 Tax=Sulfoacidibacillus thermotolerans TaxID=1765684 RepID=A0A2U3D6V2_SULT2|nr:MFS transporter [Sulfoacidibacillus thermotolerans]PWI57007.1 MFS transporter [Sulfoacidibacillus thermotolerans]